MAAGDGDSFMVNIRTSVEREYTLFSKKPAVVHSKLCALAWIKSTKGISEADLIRPVDENALLQELKNALVARGFREPEAGKVPDIVLTVLYGRSTLKNPYDEAWIAVAGGQLGAGNSGPGPVGPVQNYSSTSGGGGAPEVSGGMELMMADRSPGGNSAKRIAAGGEKVFISVTAWEYPGFFPKGKPKQLWRTTMVVDDPGMDLNEIGGKMLAVGSAYFDREIREKEISIPSTLADATPPKNPVSETDSAKSLK